MLINRGIRNFLLFFLFITGIVIYSFYHSEDLKNFVKQFVESYGYMAVFIISYLSDIVMQPIAPDLPIFIGIMLSLNPISVVVIAIVASFLATVTGYYLGLKFGSQGFVRFYGQEKYSSIRNKYDKYKFIIPLAAISPIPYVPICWISGILRMDKYKFIIYSILPRSVRLIVVGAISYYIKSVN